MQPVSFLLNTLVSFTGGDAYTTYSAIAHVVSSKGRSIYLSNSPISFFDFREPLVIHAYTSSLSGGIIFGKMKEIVKEYTGKFGRPRLLPDFSQDGVILGIQGGESRVSEIVHRVLEYNISVSALWIQDWCGRRIQSISGKNQSRLWWNVRLLFPLIPLIS